MAGFRLRARFVDLEDMANQAGAELVVSGPGSLRWLPWTRTGSDDGLLVLGAGTTLWPRTNTSVAGVSNIWVPTSQVPGIKYACEVFDNQTTGVSMLNSEDDDRLLVDATSGANIDLGSRFLDGTQEEFSAGVDVDAQLFDGTPSDADFTGGDRAEGSIRAELDDTYGIGINGTGHGLFVIPHQFDANAGSDGQLSVTVPPSNTVSKPYKITIWDTDGNTGNVLFRRSMWVGAGGLDLNAWVRNNPTQNPISETRI